MNAAIRNRKARQTVAALMWAARWPVIAEQLAQLRQTYP